MGMISVNKGLGRALAGAARGLDAAHWPDPFATAAILA
jgi:hypothetical protein